MIIIRTLLDAARRPKFAAGGIVPPARITAGKPQDAICGPSAPKAAPLDQSAPNAPQGATQRRWHVIKGHRWWFAIGPGHISAFTTQQHAMAYADREARKP